MKRHELPQIRCGALSALPFDRNGRSMTVGVMAPGEYHFNTVAPERMTVVSGELRVSGKHGGATERP